MTRDAMLFLPAKVVEGLLVIGVIQRRYAALLKTCGIPPIKIHALRHQFSCRWVEHGFDTKSLSEILGHTSVRTTLDLYVHIQAETKRQYMNQMMEQAI